MILNLTALKIIEIVLAFIMAFAMGVEFDVSEKTRTIANYVWIITLALIWIFIISGV